MLVVGVARGGERGLEAPAVFKPLFRRGSVEGLVRFQHASAIYGGPGLSFDLVPPPSGVPISEPAVVTGYHPMTQNRFTHGAWPLFRGFWSFHEGNGTTPFGAALRLVFGRVGEKPDLVRSGFVGGIHGLNGAVECQLILRVDEDDPVFLSSRDHDWRETIPKLFEIGHLVGIQIEAVVSNVDHQLGQLIRQLRLRDFDFRRNFDI